MSGYYEHIKAQNGLDSRLCCVCGALHPNRHHVVQKGMGGTSDEGPTVPLCGSGTTGCHGDVHRKLLHITWSDKDECWKWCRTEEPMDDISAVAYGDWHDCRGEDYWYAR